MNLDEALQAHTMWKAKLAAYIRNPDHSINPLDVSRDDKCPFGQWLHGFGKKAYGQLPEYQTLVTEHARFHRAVGAAVMAANAGKKLVEADVLGWDSDFGISSRNIAAAIRKMKECVGVS